MIHTNRCKNCGEKKEDHMGGAACDPKYGEWDSYYLDSGLAALDAHKEELYNAIMAFRDNDGLWGDVNNILNQIEKEK